MSRAFITGRVAIDSMRDNGYKNTAYAVAELIDNSIQAGASRVDLICIEKNKVNEGSQRRIKKVDEILILDNGKGMSAATLHLALEFGASENKADSEGMGKFGMGLPNSSISQCKRVEVWSWKKPGEYNFTFLDIDDMKSGALEVIPEVTDYTIPAHIIKALPNGIPDSGTLIKWSKLDRLVWSTSKSIKRHSEDLVGRMYRQFMKADQASVWFHSYIESGTSPIESSKFLPNDPLYLTKNSSLCELPSPYKNDTFFENVMETPIPVIYKGEEYTVVIKSSCVKKNIFDYIRAEKNSKLGTTIWGKHCAKNLGVSVVRSGRELELNAEFIPYKLRDTGRFMGLEVSFPPGLDEVFGVTNNKQHAVNFAPFDIDYESEKEGYSIGEYLEELEINNDPKLVMKQVTEEVNNQIALIMDKFKTLNFGNKKSGAESSANIDVSRAATEATNDRIEKGHGIQSDDEKPTEESLKELFKSKGFTPDEAKPSIDVIMEQNLNFFIENKELESDIFFDVSTRTGLSLVLVNQSHPFYSQIMNSVDDTAKHLLNLTLAAWARMENESSLTNRDRLRNYRVRWGEMLCDYLPEPDD
jgi:hypothetical protein